MDLFYLKFRMVYALLLRWNYGLFKKHCPQCGQDPDGPGRARPDGLKAKGLFAVSTADFEGHVLRPCRPERSRLEEGT